LYTHAAGTTPRQPGLARLYRLVVEYADRPADLRRLHGNAPLDSAAGIHLLAEIANQTYGWRLAAFGDPDFVPQPDPLGDAILTELASGVHLEKVSPSRCLGHYTEGDTTQFAIVDGSGNGNEVSWAQSLGLGFGSGVGVPD
jgi:gamma-glutamyltranspeptidase / glutathione hydrolase